MINKSSVLKSNLVWQITMWRYRRDTTEPGCANVRVKQVATARFLENKLKRLKDYNSRSNQVDMYNLNQKTDLTPDITPISHRGGH